MPFLLPESPTIPGSSRGSHRRRRSDVQNVFDAPATITADDEAEIVLRAADGVRPVLRAAAPIVISGGDDARVTLNGFVVEGAPIEIAPDPDGTSLKEVSLQHMTLIPGLAFTDSGAPATWAMMPSQATM